MEAALGFQAETGWGLVTTPRPVKQWEEHQASSVPLPGHTAQ